MTDDQFAKAKALSEEQWKQTVRIIAPTLGVNAEELLRKAPRFPANPRDPGQLQAAFNEIEVKAEDWTDAELQVCLLAHKAMVEVLWGAIRDRYPDLPEFGGKKSDD